MPRHAKSRRRRPIEHKGLWAGRHKQDVSARERIFGEHWRRENDERRGDGILQKLMVRPDKPGKESFSRRLGFGGPRVFIIGRIEAKIAASVVEWLGTNVGFGFLTGVLRECGFDLVPRKEWNKMAAVRECTSVSKQWSGNCPHCGASLPGRWPDRIMRFRSNDHTMTAVVDPPKPIVYRCPTCAGQFTVAYNPPVSRCVRCGIQNTYVVSGLCEDTGACRSRTEPAIQMRSSLPAGT